MPPHLLIFMSFTLFILDHSPDSYRDDRSAYLHLKKVYKAITFDNRVLNWVSTFANCLSSSSAQNWEHLSEFQRASIRKSGILLYWISWVELRLSHSDPLCTPSLTFFTRNHLIDWCVCFLQTLNHWNRNPELYQLSNSISRDRIRTCIGWELCLTAKLPLARGGFEPPF